MVDNIYVRKIMTKALGEEQMQKLPPTLYARLHNRILARVKQIDVAQSSDDEIDIRDVRIRDVVRARRLKTEQPVIRAIEQFVPSDDIALSIAEGALLQVRPPVQIALDTCLVLSGGAALGSFQVGFLAYLEKMWDKLNITCVAGTSVGAVNALAIAESGVAGIGKLVNIWLSLRKNSDMYDTHPDVVALNGAYLIPVFDTTLDKMFSDISSLGGNIPDFQTSLGVSYGGAGISLLGLAAGGPLGLIAAGVGSVLSLFGIGETQSGLQQLEFKMQMLEEVVERISRLRGLYVFSPLRNLIVSQLDTSKIGTDNNPRMRLACVALEDGDTYYFTEKRELLRAHADRAQAKEIWTLKGTDEQKIIDGTIASAAFPVLFPAVELFKSDNPTSPSQHFIDGGARELLPIEAALDLSYSRVVALLAGPDLEPMPIEDQPTSLATGLRTMAITLDEVEENEIEQVPQQSNSIFSRPEVTVFPDSFTVDPGLIRINMDYGYMRGYEATLKIAGKNLNVWAALTVYMTGIAITELRVEIWRLERGVANRFPEPYSGQMIDIFNEGILRQIRDKKRKLLELAELRFTASGNDPDALPMSLGSTNGASNIEEWWTSWEQHSSDDGDIAAILSRNELWAPLRTALFPIDFDRGPHDMPSTNRF